MSRRASGSRLAIRTFSVLFGTSFAVPCTMVLALDRHLDLALSSPVVREFLENLFNAMIRDGININSLIDELSDELRRDSTSSRKKIPHHFSSKWLSNFSFISGAVVLKFVEINKHSRFVNSELINLLGPILDQIVGLDQGRNVVLNLSE